MKNVLLLNVQYMYRLFFCLLSCISLRIFMAFSTENQSNENGLRTVNNNFEEIINLPVGSKPMKLDSLNNEGNSIQDLPPLNPLIAFEVDNVQTPQTAGTVIIRTTK